jgi:short-subunit dehydrogenase
MQPYFHNAHVRKVVVFGASQGIGKELALNYAANGAEVVLVSRTEAALTAVAEECRLLYPAARVHVVAADVGTEEGARDAMARVTQSLGGALDVIVLNHVLGQWGWWLDTPSEKQFEHARNMFAVNCFSYIYLSTLALPLLQKSAEGTEHGGQLIVVSSGAGKSGLPKVAGLSTRTQPHMHT